MNENKFNESRDCYCDMYGDYERRKCNVCADKENELRKSTKRSSKVKPKKKQRK